MSRSILLTFLAAVTLLHSAAYAEVLYDLPNLEEGASMPPTPPPPPPPPVRTPREEPRERPQESRVGKVIVKEITRKTGGALYRIELRRALPLTNVDVKILKGNLKLREGALITDRGERVAIREFKDVQVLPAESKLFSENLNLTTPVSAIEIRAESYLETADLQIEATSDVQAPVLRLKVEAPKPPAPPKPSEPVEQTPSRVTPIKVGERVMYTNNSSISFGRVLEMFQSGDVRILIDDYSSPSIVHISTLGKNVNCVASSNGTFCKNDRILYQNSSSFIRGYVKEAFSNGKMRVLFDDYSSTSTIDVSRLIKSVNCMNGNCKGDPVLYTGQSSPTSGVVVEAFKNGIVYVRLLNYSSDSAVRGEKLQSTVNSTGVLTVNDAVLYIGGYSPITGVIKQIYDGGLALVQLKDYSTGSFVQANKLVKSVRCTDLLCVGDRILHTQSSGNKIVGVVSQLFATDLAVVQLKDYGSTSFVRLGGLIKEKKCVSGFCKGGRVLHTSSYGQKNAATIISIFDSDSVIIRIDGYSTDSIVSARQLVK